MANARLALALEGGLLDLPGAGRLGLFRPGTDIDLSLFPTVEIAVVHGFWPSVDFFRGRGVAVSPHPEGTYTDSIVFLPRSKHLQLTQVMPFHIATLAVLL